MLNILSYSFLPLHHYDKHFLNLEFFLIIGGHLKACQVQGISSCEWVEGSKMRIGFSCLMVYCDDKEDTVNHSMTTGLSRCENASVILSVKY